MKAKNIKIKTLDEGLCDFKKAFQKAQKGKKAKKTISKVYFSSLEAVRKILTKGRVQVLRAIKEHKPQSIYELAKILKKDLKNIRMDLNVLSEMELVEIENTQNPRKQKRPVLITDHIILELAI